jgi:hypothetical protein
VGAKVRGNGHGSPTEAVAFSPFQRQKRSKVRRAAEGSAVPSGRSSARSRSFGAPVRRPRKVDDRAFISQVDFDRALHLQRERELSGEV